MTLFLLLTSLAQAQDSITATVSPRQPYIELSRHEKYLNFDLILQNHNGKNLRLNRVQISIFDERDQLVLRKFVDGNGVAPGLLTLGKLDLSDGETIDTFNPFYQFSEDVPLHRMHYEFFFERAGKASALPVDFAAKAELDVLPTVYRDRTELFLPLKGKIIVWDGHDYYSHHRRLPVSMPEMQQKGLRSHSNRYAYDFIPLGPDDQLYQGDLYQAAHCTGTARPSSLPDPGRSYHPRMMSLTTGMKGTT